MKNTIIILMLISALILSGCEMLYPQQNTPTPQPIITYTPVPVATETQIPILNTISPTVEATPTEAITPIVLFTKEPVVDLTFLPQVSPVIIDIDDYMAGSYYKAGDGFHDAVDVVYITSSSVLSPQAGNSYEPGNLYDFDLDTVWCEGRTGVGIGEWALYRVKAFDYAPNAVITKVEVINGYIKTDDLFDDNSMAKKILVSVDDVNICILVFDVSKEIQQFDIPDISLSVTDAKVIKFEILEVYEGDVYEDTCITAIEFSGTGIY